MMSLNNKDAWRGDIDASIPMSIRDAGMPLVDLTNDGDAGPSGAVKDEPIDEPDEHDKQDVIDDAMYNFHRYYDPGCCNLSFCLGGVAGEQRPSNAARTKHVPPDI
jgi:hypothetical protein